MPKSRQLIFKLTIDDTQKEMQDIWKLILKITIYET